MMIVRRGCGALEGIRPGPWCFAFGEAELSTRDVHPRTPLSPEEITDGLDIVYMDDALAALLMVERPLA